MSKTPKVTNIKSDQGTNKARTRPGKADSPRLSDEEIAKLEQDAVANDANNRKS
jgi:hypothetical protein